jgi:hypothetical protein
MTEPNFWNPLPLAADWLSQATGQPIDARGLVDLVARSGKMGTPAPTVIKAMMPRTARFALLAMPGHPQRDSFMDGATHTRLSAAFGGLPGGLAYIQEVRQDVMPLCVNDLLELLMRGEAPVSLLFTGRSDEIVFLMPFNSQHPATIEECGINRADLVALEKSIIAARPKPAETTANRDSRWLLVFLEEEKRGPKRGAMSRVTQRVAKSEGVKAEAVKKGIQRARKQANDAEVGGVFKGLV